ncbi:GMC family oxidoreductase [Georgenia sp. Z1344]|uniref:GMC family oxidoreductase n=1 Tax=Georgenia sp. Z1344 TaxID=3416706 RepID=UPI003CF81C5A
MIETGRAADVVVVGAGAAGCALAARLADLGRRVLIVEAGAFTFDPVVTVPMGFVRTMVRPGLSSQYEVRPAQEGVAPEPDGACPGSAGEEPDPAGDDTGGNAHGSSETWLRGRGPGGSTLVNGTMYLRGEPHLYDALAADLGAHWSWREFEPAFEAIERRLPVPPPASDPGDSEVLRALAGGLASTGVPFVPDVRAAVGPRAGRTPASIVRGRRAAAWRLVARHLATGRVRLVQRERAVRVVLERGRAVGVEVVDAKGRRLLHRGREVVLTAGALETPQLLERSGVGDPDRLASLGIELQVASPQVGEGLREQRGATVKVRVRDGLGMNAALRGRGLRRSVLEYLLTGSGRLARGPYDLVASVDSRGGQHPDLQLLLTEVSTDDDGLTPSGHAGLMVQAFPLVPRATGSVHVTGADVDAPPEVRGPLLGDPADREMAARALEAARAVVGSDAVAAIDAEELVPGRLVPSGDVAAAARYVRDTGGAIFHSVGTAAAGGTGAVLDERLRVRGVGGLRVADLSALPSHTSGGTQSVAMALGHLAGGWIGEDGVAGREAHR